MERRHLTKVHMPSLYLLIMPNVITATEAVERVSDVLSRAHDEADEEFVWEKDGQVILRFRPVRGPLTGEEILERRRQRPPVPRLTSEEAESFARDVEEVRNLVNKPPVLHDW